MSVEGTSLGEIARKGEDWTELAQNKARCNEPNMPLKGGEHPDMPRSHQLYKNDPAR